MSDVWGPLVLVGLGVVMAMLTVVLFKLIRVHVATFRVVEDVAAIRRESDCLFAQLQAHSALERVLRLDRPLPPLRGWAGSPDFLLFTADAIRDRRPGTVMELGSGASTLVVARCLQINGLGHLYSIEHDPAYADETRRLLERHGLRQWVTILVAPLERDSADRLWYAERNLPDDLPSIDLLIVDGPPYSTAPQARAPAYERLRARLSSRFLIVVDDADRPDEQAMVRQWCALDPRLKESRVRAEKGLALLQCDG